MANHMLEFIIWLNMNTKHHLSRRNDTAIMNYCFAFRIYAADCTRIKSPIRYILI